MEQILDAEFGCRKCGKTVLSKQYKFSRFCPDCGTLLHSLKFWIFQFNPTVYRWYDWIKKNRESEQWLTSQHAKEIRKGDRVVIWASGEKAGIYALGEVLENPSKRALSPKQQKYWIKREDIHKFEEKKSVIIKYLKLMIDKPILEDVCRKDHILKTMEILKQPQGTNFLLTKEQWKRILKLTR
ncbi:MAG: EVE domain-containing protein [Candidatus Bathyarchaeota archaeon]|nr:EVE domain-containing protein [Candidatus Bathyarchaeota archaeon]